MQSFAQLISRVLQHRYMIQAIAMRDIKARYVGSIMGIFWSVIYPITMVFIYWFIFSLGFKVQPQQGVPFVVWFFCAFAPWTTFNEMVSGTTSSVIQHQALIKKTLFPSEVLPFIYVISSSITHLIMIIILVVMLLLNDLSFSLYSLQFFYYWLLMIIGMTGFGWAVSALNVFIRDIGQVISVLLQIWFWATPIFWQLSMLPERYHILLKLNPMYYVVEGYRDSFLYHRGFWEKPELSLYSWGVALTMFILGGLLFKKLKREFADVL